MPIPMSAASTLVPTPSPSLTPTLTIGQLAEAGGVGVETVRYYQRRGLLVQPRRAQGSIRRYSLDDAARIRFIKRAQELGFSLDEIAELLQLQDPHRRGAVRQIAQARLAQIEARRKDLQRMARALQHLIEQCEQGTSTLSCPIINTLAARTSFSRTSPST